MTLSQRIKARTDDGDTIIDFLVDVMEDRYEDFQICHRLQAAQLLTTYGNEDAPNFIDDNTTDSSSSTRKRKPRHPTKFDTELARVIREDTQDGRSIARFLVDVMVGELTSFKPHHRMSAARELLDRGFGKSARNEKIARSRIESGAGSEPVEGPEPVPSVRPEPVEGPEPVPSVRPEPVEGPDSTEGLNPTVSDTSEITRIPESQKSQFRQPTPSTDDTNGITLIPESQESEFRQPTEEQTLTPHSSTLTPQTTTPHIDVADDTDYWPYPCDSPLHDFMSECEHPDFDPCLATIDEDYFESFTACTNPECEVHGDPDEIDFDPNNYHY